MLLSISEAFKLTIFNLNLIETSNEQPKSNSDVDKIKGKLLKSSNKKKTKQTNRKQFQTGKCSSKSNSGKVSEKKKCNAIKSSTGKKELKKCKLKKN